MGGLEALGRAFQCFRSANRVRQDRKWSAEKKNKQKKNREHKSQHVKLHPQPHDLQRITPPSLALGQQNLRLACR